MLPCVAGLTHPDEAQTETLTQRNRSIDLATAHAPLVAKDFDRGFLPRTRSFGNGINHTTGLNDTRQERARAFKDLDAIDRGCVVEHACKGLTLAIAIDFILAKAAHLVGVGIVGLVLVADVGDATNVIRGIRESERSNIV